MRALGSNKKRKTTLEAYEQFQGILAMNVGYFSDTSSVSVLVSDGEVVSPGPSGEEPHGSLEWCGESRKFSGQILKTVSPRTSIGYKDKNTLLLMVVQGRQQASAGVSLPKLAVLLLLILGSRERFWLRMDKKPVNTLTKMDIFHDRDTIVYSTYIFKEKKR